MPSAWHNRSLWVGTTIPIGCHSCSIKLAQSFRQIDTGGSIIGNRDYLLQCSSTPAESISAPIGGFRLERRSSISSIAGNSASSLWAIRPHTCSSNLEETDISAFTASCMSAQLTVSDTLSVWIAWLISTFNLRLIRYSFPMIFSWCPRYAAADLASFSVHRQADFG